MGVVAKSAKRYYFRVMVYCCQAFTFLVNEELGWYLRRFDINHDEGKSHFCHYPFQTVIRSLILILWNMYVLSCGNLQCAIKASRWWKVLCPSKIPLHRLLTLTYTSNVRGCRVGSQLWHKSVRILTPCVQCPHWGDLRVWRAILSACLLHCTSQRHVAYKNVFMTDEVIEYVPRLQPGNGQHQSQFGWRTLDTASSRPPSRRHSRIDDALIIVAILKGQLLCNCRVYSMK